VGHSEGLSVGEGYLAVVGLLVGGNEGRALVVLMVGIVEGRVLVGLMVGAVEGLAVVGASFSINVIT
jgi:hypothetical protein